MTAPLLLHSPAAMQAWSAERSRSGLRIAVVPTMGALHAGHEALIAEAQRRSDVQVVTIFVNPLQFDRPEDFTTYPRPEEADLEICARWGVDAIYLPTAATMYPEGFDTRVEPGAIAAGFEGAHRPGHFTGVATVVTKLFNAVRPDVAIFGRKDAQQLALVSRMVADLDLGIEIVGLPTVREADGVALSSRNRRLSPEGRAAAVCIPRALEHAVAELQRGEQAWPQIRAAALEILAAEPRAELEYLELVDARTFTALERIDGSVEGLVIAAVWVDGVRLIDNQAVVHASS